MLDINTPKGRIAAEQQAVALEIVTQNTGIKFYTTDDTSSAGIDAFGIGDDGVVKFAAEVKSRQCTIQEFQHAFNNEWLVTFDKLLKGADISRMLGIYFVGYLYLVPSDIVLAARIANSVGEFVSPMRIARTITQKTTNGGTIERTNAYINMASARKYNAT